MKTKIIEPFIEKMLMLLDTNDDSMSSLVDEDFSYFLEDPVIRQAMYPEDGDTSWAWHPFYAEMTLLSMIDRSNDMSICLTKDDIHEYHIGLLHHKGENYPFSYICPINLHNDGDDTKGEGHLFTIMLSRKCPLDDNNIDGESVIINDIIELNENCHDINIIMDEPNGGNELMFNHFKMIIALMGDVNKHTVGEESVA